MAGAGCKRQGQRFVDPHWSQLAVVFAFMSCVCVVLCCVGLRCAALHCIALHCVALRCVVFCCVVLCCVVLCCVVLCCVVLCCVVLGVCASTNSQRMAAAQDFGLLRHAAAC